MNLTKEEKHQDIMTNVNSILLYSLSMVVALGLNDLVTSIFNSFPNTQHIIAKVTYVVIMFGLTLLAVYYLSKV